MSVRERSLTSDSLDNKGRTEADDVQVMSAGTGFTHSDYNFEDTETRIFQIWIILNASGLPPAGLSRRRAGTAASRCWPAATRMAMPCRSRRMAG
jgi:redox-sensitive bicupin YhaK (pirin superfamily)